MQTKNAQKPMWPGPWYSVQIVFRAKVRQSKCSGSWVRVYREKNSAENNTAVASAAAYTLISIDPWIFHINLYYVRRQHKIQ